MKPRAALRAVFDYISLQIENLVAEQIAEVSEKNLSVKVDNYPCSVRDFADLNQGNTPCWRLWGEQIPI